MDSKDFLEKEYTHEELVSLVKRLTLALNAHTEHINNLHLKQTTMQKKIRILTEVSESLLPNDYKEKLNTLFEEYEELELETLDSLKH